LPRDVAADDLEKVLRRALGHEGTRQTGSHRRLTKTLSGQHHLTLPAHDTLKPGTRRAIPGEVAAHHRLSLEDLFRRLFP
jgi:predicted RNA binding protein YcfA (HicA-like mRNA interferase family)